MVQTKTKLAISKIILPFALGSTVWFCAGCESRHYTRFDVDSKRYIVYDHRQQQQLSMVLIQRKLAVLGEGQIQNLPFLTVRPPRDISEASHMFEAARPQYLLDPLPTPNLLTLCRYMVSNTENEQGDYVRWVLSVDPVVVAIGTRRERGRYAAEILSDRVQLYSNFKLPTTDDLTEPVSAIFVLDHWPNWPKPYSESLGDPWRKEVVSNTRKIDLPTGTNIKELFDNPDIWLSRKDNSFNVNQMR
jgi:hypothetical protein